jgi:hypothetical protein
MASNPRFRLLCLAAAVAAATTTAQAETKIGSRYYETTQVGPGQTIEVFLNVNNINGIHLDTIAIECSQIVVLEVIPPTPPYYPESIASCPGPATGFAATQIQGIFLPPGWGLRFQTGSDNGNSLQNGLYVTYDNKK